jgi:hypothetical protein
MLRVLRLSVILFGLMIAGPLHAQVTKKQADDIAHKFQSESAPFFEAENTAQKAIDAMDWQGACTAYQSSQKALEQTLARYQALFEQNKAKSKPNNEFAAQVDTLINFRDIATLKAKLYCNRADEEKRDTEISAKINENQSQFLTANLKLEDAQKLNDWAGACAATKQALISLVTLNGLYGQLMQLERHAADLEALKMAQDMTEIGVSEYSELKNQLCGSVTIS